MVRDLLEFQLPKELALSLALLGSYLSWLLSLSRNLSVLEYGFNLARNHTDAL